MENGRDHPVATAGRHGSTVDTRAARLARASVTASVSTLVTALSHAVAGGTAPHPALVLVAFALALVFCLALTGRALSPSRVLVAVGVSQALLHGVFAMTGAPSAALQARMAETAGMSGTPVMAHASGMGHTASLADPAAAVGHHGSLMPADAAAGGVDSGMLLAHVLAGLVTVLALVAGERSFWGLFDSLRLAGSALLRFAVLVAILPTRPVRPSSLVIAGALFRPRPRQRLMLALRHRGPPALTV